MRGKGFTLVELLVTISILSILMTIAILSYTNVQRNSRDARRKSDISTIQSALEQYHSDQGYYPLSITFGSSLKNPSLTKIYMTKIPKEQQSGIPEYSYTPKPSPTCDNTDPTKYCTNYCLLAFVENDSNAHLASDPPCTASTSAQYQVEAP